MKRAGQFKFGAFGLVVGLLYAAGCQHSDRPGTYAHAPPPPSEPTPRINTRQAADVQLALGRSLEQRGDTTQAMAAYHEAEKRDPERADPCVRLAVLLDCQGKFRESAEQYRQALQRAPRNPDIHCDLGYSFYLQRRWAEAEMSQRQALTLNPDHVRAHNNLALVLARTDRFEEAFNQFRLGGNDTAQTYVNLAFALALEQRWDEARSHYQYALSLNPKSAPARQGLADLDGLLARVQPTAPPTQNQVQLTSLPEASAPAPSFAHTFVHVGMSR